MTIAKTIQKLNKRLAEEFGSSSSGEPKFKWVRTTNLFYLYKTGKLVEGRTPAGIVTLRNEWVQHPYSRLYGDHWLLAAWTPPCVYDTNGDRIEVDESEWFRQLAGAFPWPGNGEFIPFEGMVLPTGVVPDEPLNEFTISRLYIHLGMTNYQRQILTDIAIEKSDQQDQKTWDAALDDALPAFGSVPKDMLSDKTRWGMVRVKHVSFPTVQKATP